ncbi:hypothetical protein ALQ32_01005 [Pseudomonas syringae pv. tagetis]|uniref:Uncharacterized protein n=1 Tax=Pseudomonas syringae pv. tagetis TaxID=129140 RepID=A0A3M3YWV3_9PSED|nr:hypothetical protein [Pseudomonas syringae group genomosp. 7]RMO87050.1 hypothetical protein ALQ32_01005 [Pseudomonas syringae pv. tagetis]
MFRPGQRATNRRICFDVDRAFCISLSERDDRRKLFLETVGPPISNPIGFFITERCDDPVRGCYESHQGIARQVLDQGWERVLVFEDDAQPYGIRFTQGWWINRFIRRNRFHALHLGYSMGRTWMTWFPFIARGSVVALHAYIVSREGCRILVDTPYSGVPVDVMFKQSMRQHCAYPMLYRQHAAAVAGSNILVSAINEDDWWQRNWRKHWVSLLKNCWRTLLRIRF